MELERREIINWIVVLRWIITVILIFGLQGHTKYQTLALITASIFCEIYCYLWQYEKAKSLAKDLED